MDKEKKVKELSIPEYFKKYFEVAEREGCVMEVGFTIVWHDSKTNTVHHNWKF